MLDDLVPINFNLPADRNIKIYPIGDLHYGSIQFDKSAWTKFVEKIINEPNTYLLIVGDMVDNGLKTSVTSTYEQTVRPADQKRWVAEQLKPFKGRIIAGVQGNHEHRSTKDSDDDPLYDVFCILGIDDRYRENAAFISLKFDGANPDRMKKNSRLRPTYSLCLIHGAGGGTYIGSSAIKNEKFLNVCDGVDILVTGHSHKPMNMSTAKIVFDAQNSKITQKTAYSVVCGSWLKYGGYALKKMLPPAALTNSHIILTAEGKKITIVHE